MSQSDSDAGQAYIRRLQSNLEYFKRHRPDLFLLASGMVMQRVELVVTPGAKDVDMTVDGVSSYRGLAKAFSLDEVDGFIRDNPEDKPIVSFPPPKAETHDQPNFDSQCLKRIIDNSPVTRENFKGYIHDGFYPSVVFLGCGLGYQIQALAEKKTIVNAIIIEREPEKFAVSLYTVDWARICAKFDRRGHSLTFAIGKADTPDQIRGLIARNLIKDVPFYPFFTTYYNHLADVELARGAIENGKDVAVVSASWSNYDSETLRLVNTTHNVRRGIGYITNRRLDARFKPLVVVGSGPSIDQRVESLKAVREQVVVVSAGTGLRPLLAAGIRPDFHLELDPSYLIYELLSEMGSEQLKGIPLLAVNEVNPLVPSLFDESYFFFKEDNCQGRWLGVGEAAFPGCNPTCTNAVLSIGAHLGFRKVFLFGTDYGFADEQRDHSDHSIYGKAVKTELAEDLQRAKKREVFAVPAVSGGTVLTRNDYYSAKRSVEELIAGLHGAGIALEVYNCADGAVIEGAHWLDGEAFIQQVGDSDAADSFVLADVFEKQGGHLDATLLESALQDALKELQRTTRDFARTIKDARLRGRKDLALLVNQLRLKVKAISPAGGRKQITGAQFLVTQLMQGSIRRLLYVGMSHGLACGDKELPAFLTAWRNECLYYLEEVPAHFERVVVRQPSVAEDPWVTRRLGGVEPGFEPGVAGRQG